MPLVRIWFLCALVLGACREHDGRARPVTPISTPLPATPLASADTTRGSAASPPEPSREQDAYARHIAGIRERLAQKAPDTSFHILVEPPFIVIGDEPAAMVQKRAASTVRWAVERLRKVYFSNEPEEILEIWLFAGEASYLAHARALFGDEPDTPYGYYSPRHGALIMNIATGGGTLVHEIVHPFIRANFPGCPAWFNEGLGSLYEQAGERDGHIIGYTNWRLAGLQQAIRTNRLPDLQTLLATTDQEFYGRDSGMNYAQARYLLYYLQEHGLLHEYYRRFRGNAGRDPTGYETLRAVLGQADMDAFFAQWKAYVLTLRFP